MFLETEKKPIEFDDYIESYEEACESGLQLSGEGRDYFAQKRVEYTRRRCPCPNDVRTIVDFGCGLGHSTPKLCEAFSFARVIGVDSSARSIEAAQKRYGSERIEFFCSPPKLEGVRADLVYCNGVFHHIEPADRIHVAGQVSEAMRPGGWFALWENNPWNPGTRMVMRRIPFDRDAIPLSYLEAERLLRSAGFHVAGTRFYFYFPALLRRLRTLEAFLDRVPLGAQYCVLAQKPIS